MLFGAPVYKAEMLFSGGQAHLQIIKHESIRCQQRFPVCLCFASKKMRAQKSCQ